MLTLRTHPPARADRRGQQRPPARRRRCARTPSASSPRCRSASRWSAPPRRPSAAPRSPARWPALAEPSWGRSAPARRASPSRWWSASSRTSRWCSASWCPSRSRCATPSATRCSSAGRCSALSWLMRPLVWLLTASSNLLLRFFGDRTTFTEARLSPEELQQLVEEAAKTGSLDPRARARLPRAPSSFGELTAVGGDGAAQPHRGAARGTRARRRSGSVLLEHGHSRMPVYEGTLDNIVGYVIAKDLLGVAWEGEPDRPGGHAAPALLRPRDHARPWTCCKELQRRRMQLAIVVDERGGVLRAGHDRGPGRGAGGRHLQRVRRRPRSSSSARARPRRWCRARRASAR